MIDKDNFNDLLEFASRYRDSIKKTNAALIDFLNSDVVNAALTSVAESSRLVVSSAYDFPEISKGLSVFSQTYVDMLEKFEALHAVEEVYKTILSSSQVDALFKLSRLPQTTMVKDLQDCFANARYDVIVDVLNKAVNTSDVSASDFAFIKTASIVDLIRSEISFPKGMLTSLNKLNLATAGMISDNNDIIYSISHNRFETLNGSVDSRGLNIICSGKEILSTGSEELFTESELIDFMSYLASKPMLGYLNSTGQKIMNHIKSLFDNRENTMDFDKRCYFHCRSRNEDTVAYTYDQMLRAPVGLPWAGRFNHVGQSHYYFSDTRNGAEAEVKKHLRKDDILQTVKIAPVRGINLLDLSNTLARGATFLRYIRFPLDGIETKMPREYLLPCFVSDCCKEIGFDGIKYYGTKDYSNYVTWYDGFFEFIGMC